MSRKLLYGIGVGLCLHFGNVAPANACGLKLTMQAAKAKKPVAPSENPSRILLVGSAPSNLDDELARAGHHVESVEKTDKAKGKDYKVVLVEDDRMIEQAREQWPDAHVLTMSKRTSRTLASVEKSLERAPKQTAVERPVIAQAEQRVPVAVGPEDTEARGGPVAGGSGAGAEVGAVAAAGSGGERTPVARSAELPSEAEPAAKAEPVVAKKAEPAPVVAKAEPVEEEEEEEAPVALAKAEPAKAKPALAPAQKEKAAVQKAPVALVAARTAAPRAERAPAKLTENQLRFGLGSSGLSKGARSILGKHARWLKQNASATVVLEGHADSTGSADLNMALSARRAEAARDYLIKLGIEASRISTVSYGEDRPVFEPGTDARNRCVVVVHGSQG